MGRVGLIMAALALVTVALANLIPALGQLLVAPLTSLIVGAGAGWWASKVLGYGTAGRGAGAGAIAGIGALIGSVIGLALLAYIVANNPEAQAQFQQELQRQLQQESPQDPEVTRALRNLNFGAVAGIGGAFGGFCLGLFNLLLSMIGGLIAGVVYGRNRQPAAMPYAGYPAGGTSLPQMTNTMETEPDRGARIYPDDQRRE